MRHDAKVGRALAAIPESAWVLIPYWDSHVDPDTGELVASAAQVAEVPYVAFQGTKHEVGRPPGGPPGPAAAAPGRGRPSSTSTCGATTGC